jgi:dihydroflavonol-4-reductase
MASAMLGKRAPALICPMGPARFCAPLVTGYARMTGRRPLFTSASLNALVCNRHISHARATREIGYHPRPIKETVHDTLLWFRDNGYLKDA